MPGRKTLIITAPPTILGGAATLARIMADHLGALGHTVTVAHYATLSAERELTGSLPRLLRGGRPGTRRYRAWDGTAFVSVGCWLP